jgi:2-desacetyl-2-hydroxyethyl bacteriochlorophyllide A dehydrogenase
LNVVWFALRMMNAIVCESPGRLTVMSKPIPTRSAGEVLIRIRRVGICGTDMHIFRGTQPYLSYPRVMGHELAGEVAEASPDSALKPGDPVYVMPYLSCGRCSACAKARTNCCRNIQVLGVHRDGGLAEYLSIPEAFVCRAEGVTLDEAAMVEFLAIGAHAVRRAQIVGGSQVLVVGAGPIGIATAIFAMIDGASVTMLDSRQDRLDFCRDKLGTSNALAVDKHTHDELDRLTAGQMFDSVFDATGSREAMQAGFSYVGHGGSYVFVSIVNGDITFSDPEFHRREMTLLGSRNATVQDFERVLCAMRERRVPTAELNTHRTRLLQFPDILPQWMAPTAGIIKGIVEC